MNIELKVLIVEKNDEDFLLLQQMLEKSKTYTFKITRTDSTRFLTEIPLKSDQNILLAAQRSFINSNGSEMSQDDLFKTIGSLNDFMPTILLLDTEDEKIEMEANARGVQDVLIKTELNSRFLVKSILYAVERHHLEKELNALGKPVDNRGRFDNNCNQVLIELIGEGVMFSDKDEVIKYSNPMAEKIFGVPKNELVGRLIKDLLTPEQFEVIQAQTSLRENGTKSTYELEITTRNGETRTLMVTGNPWYNDAGEYIGTFGVFSDVTEQLQAQKKMLLLKKALETMQLGVTITNLKREIIYINPAEARMHGYTVEELKNKESRIFGLKGKWKALTVEDVKRMESWERESVNKHKNGSIFPVHLISDVVKDNKGEPFGIVTCCMDITGRKKAERALKSTTEYLTGILESQLDLVKRVNAEGRLTYANEAYCSAFGKSFEELLGTKFQPEIHEDDRKKQHDLMEFLERPPYRIYYEQRTKTVDGWRWLAWQGYAIRGDMGDIVEIQSVGRDVTEQKEMEEELRLYATTDTMTGVQNRRTGILILEKKMQLAKRTNVPLVVSFVDINNLKDVNDNYGHWEGDELIRIISGILREALRQSDTICRMGGDEFLLIFANCSLKEAKKIWKRIDIQLKTINDQKEKPYRVSFSHGFAEYKPKKDFTVDELINMADREMYREKLKFKQKQNKLGIRPKYFHINKANSTK